jgi:hypothetical protein
MTVRELIDKLESLPRGNRELPVGFYSPTWDRQGKLTSRVFEEIDQVALRFLDDHPTHRTGIVVLLP